jgi:hypothetical protein
MFQKNDLKIIRAARTPTSFLPLSGGGSSARLRLSAMSNAVRDVCAPLPLKGGWSGGPLTRRLK